MRLNTGNGPITIDTNQLIGRGGEAKVYAVNGNRKFVAKIYHKPTIDRADKLRAMVGHAPADPGLAQGHVSIAWPEDLLLDSSGSVVGYLMSAIKGSYPLSEVYNPVARRQTLPAGFGYQYLLRTAHNLCIAVSAVHDMGYVIGDLNDCNILVQPDARVTLIDCDSFQVGKFACLVGRPEYTAPEILGCNFSTSKRKAEQDCFALAILVYQLIMAGYHPYAGVGGPGDLAERIKAALCPHASNGSKQPPRAPKLEWLSLSLQQLVKETFVNGHGVPSDRPEARVWAKQLMAASQELIPCKRDPCHPHFKHLSKCPVCQAQATRKRQPQNPRAATVGGKPQQQPLPGLGAQAKGARGQQYMLASVLIVVATIAYNWQSMGRTGEQLISYTKGQNATRIFSHSIDAFTKKTPRTQETAYEIYRKAIGRLPHQQRDSGVSSYKKHLLSQKRNSTTLLQRHQETESASDIYRRIIGKDPY